MEHQFKNTGDYIIFQGSTSAAYELGWYCFRQAQRVFGIGFSFKICVGPLFLFRDYDGIWFGYKFMNDIPDFH